MLLLLAKKESFYCTILVIAAKFRSGKIKLSGTSTIYLIEPAKLLGL